MSRKEIENIFPHLKKEGYTITSKETLDYNCIAWAADDDKWWWDPNYYWLPQIPREYTIEAYKKLFESLGYKECSSYEYEDLFEKVVIFSDRDGIPTHAARQLNDNIWTSKLGQLEDIEHTLHGLDNSDYGSIAVIMKRLKKP